ncbi:DUF1801 domain-containing protein [Microvirga sp. CF3062]|uniref:DUF1801 domain-containing protein n=1 Tax=Microvirga sp. CF3062 TaxID=3110182 RepID=UPI002E77ACF6|nr:DUF1801 domain-containing protein [Microvirga sp. CF3062]MEE1655782.1 DUF1801 domain-containing protein [Microvirga sp. CF3062]
MMVPFGDLQVEAIFKAYPPAVRQPLLQVRDLILATASEIPSVGEVIETLKWGQPAYLPSRSKIGTTIRIDAVKGEAAHYAVFFHCQTTLVSTFRELYPTEFTFQGNRALVFEAGSRLSVDPFKHCVAMALTYHKDRAS